MLPVRPPAPLVLALLLVVLGVGCEPTCDPPTERRTYLVSSLRFEAAQRTRAHGFDLDGVISTGEGRICHELTPDFESITTAEDGVDNAFSALVPWMARWIDEGGARPPGQRDDVIDFAPFFTQGELLLAIDVVPLPDGGVRISLHHVEMEEPILRLDDRVAPGQRVRSITELASITRSAGQLGSRACRLEEVTAAFALPGEPGAFPPVDVAQTTHIRVTLTETGAISGLELGGTWSIEDGRTWARRLGSSSLSEDDVAEVIVHVFDMEPRPDDPAFCERISFGAIADVVQARMIE